MKINITKAWTHKVQQNIQAEVQYHHLFESKAGYQHSPFDGISIVTNKPLTSHFIQLANKLADVKCHNGNPNHPYDLSYSFDCVRVFTKPKFSNSYSVKIIINPSEGGLRFQQLIDWLDFIVEGTENTWVKAIHAKIDIRDMDTSECLRTIWWQPYRKEPDFEMYEDETVYLGSPKSRRQLVVYDKGKEMGVTDSLTRVEKRIYYKNDEMKSYDEFAAATINMDFFEDVQLITTSEHMLNELLAPYNKKVSSKHVCQTLKDLEHHQRKKVLKRLVLLDSVYYLGSLYEEQLMSWLGEADSEFETVQDELAEMG